MTTATPKLSPYQRAVFVLVAPRRRSVVTRRHGRGRRGAHSEAVTQSLKKGDG